MSRKYRLLQVQPVGRWADLGKTVLHASGPRIKDPTDVFGRELTSLCRPTTPRGHGARIVGPPYGKREIMVRVSCARCLKRIEEGAPKK